MTLPKLVGRDVEFVELTIPSNGRFSQEDLRLLWESGAELSAWRQARMALARDAGTFGAPDVTGTVETLRDWRSLAVCANQAGALLASWPSVLDRQQTWLPTAVVGGVEDILETERSVEARGALHEHDDQFVVSQSARWRGTRRDLTSVTISTLATTIVDVVRSSVPDDQARLLRPVLDPIATVARVASAPAGSRDPDPSSWPTRFVSFAAACMRTLAELQSSRRGSGVVPFLDTDELYEAWLAIAVRRVLDTRFGQWTLPESEALASWESDDARIELWIKPSIARRDTEIAGTRLHALVAEVLAPDLLLTVSRGDVAAFAVIDAKSWASMLPEQALEQSAKYLYGIRRSDDPALVPAVSGVDLVTCAVAPRIGASDISRVRVLSATPTSGLSELDDRIHEIVDQLLASLEESEHMASEF
ncbi:MAG: hypothetical protein QM774_00225 [Gordonia sp. (in: high G+C Gram-positive bacteria)]|uniref:hypothetical protein n=1 Tax=Gordonia sp. (in: high G+C Gram-positive bacteria) TaxID=84139 RepID=UPI0039E59A70